MKVQTLKDILSDYHRNDEVEICFDGDLFDIVPDKRRDEPALNAYVHARASVQATLERTEEIIDELEAELRARAPQVDHVTIEVEGIVATDEPSQA